MPKFRNFQTDFSGGLLSEGMLGRLDLAQYEKGCKQLDNWWPKVTGGMRRRPGTLFVDSFIDAIRMEPFIFNEEQVYIVLFSPGAGFAPKSGAFGGDTLQVLNLVTGAIVFSQRNLWTIDKVRELSITQKGDVMFISHPSDRTLQLVRLGAASFEIRLYEFEGSVSDNTYPKMMPFIKFEQPQSTMEPNGYKRDSQVTLVLVGAEWKTSNTNFIVRYRGKQILIQSFVSTTVATGIIKEELDRGAKLNFNTSLTSGNDFDVGEIIVGRDSGTKAEVIETNDSNIIIAMLAGRFATNEEVEGLNSGHIAKISSFQNIQPPASADWDEEAFSLRRGWPGIVEFHSQRLWFGGSSSLPAHIFGSRVAAFFNFDVGDAFPADSIQVSIVGKQINLVTDIVSGRHLQVFTDVAEFYAPQSEDRPLEPLTFDLIPQTRYGSKRTVEPKVFDESTIFIQAHGSAVREFIWQANQKGYSSEAISLIAEEHLTGITEVEVLYGGYDRPEQLAFFINGDGNIIWYHSARAEGIRTWGRWTTQGSYLSLTVVQDKLYALVERTIDGEEVTYLEVFDLDVTVDAALQTTFGSVSTSVMPDLHIQLKNTKVDVVAGTEDGVILDVDRVHDPEYYFGEFTLDSGGGLDISPLATRMVTVGLSFTQVLEPMPIEVKDQEGVTGGMPKRIVSADVYMASTLALRLNGHSMTTFVAQADLTQKPESVTGLKKFYLLGYSERPTVIIENRIPLPCEILSLGTEVEY